VHYFKIGALRLIARFHKHLVAGLHQRGNAAAEDGLLPEKVGFGFFLKSCFQYARPSSAYARRVSHSQFFRVPARILVNCYKAGNARAQFVLFAHGMARPLGRYHHDIDILRRDNLPKVDVKPVGERQGFPLFQRRRD